MSKKVASIGYEGRDKLVKGASYIASAVKKTLGPAGQNFAIEKGLRITNDGITIARELIGTQDDEIEELGARNLLDAVSKANDENTRLRSLLERLRKSVLTSQSDLRVWRCLLIQKIN